MTAGISEDLPGFSGHLEHAAQTSRIGQSDD
jgi:hypothetical protein